MSQPTPSPLKVMFRVYPDGELLALFPEEPANATGTKAVAFGLATNHMPVDVEIVLDNTKQAPDIKIGRIKKALTDHGYVLDIVKKLPAGHAEARASKPERYKDFPRIKHMVQSNP